MAETISNNQSQKKHRKWMFTAQARRSHVQAYQASGETLLAYSQKHHLALSTLSTWVKKYGSNQVPSEFVPVLTTSNCAHTITAPPSSSLPSSLHNVEIHLGESIKLVMQEIKPEDIGIFIQLVKGVKNAD